MSDEIIFCHDVLDGPPMITPRFASLASLMECLYPTYTVIRRSCRVNSFRIHVLHDEKKIFVVGRP